MIKSLFITLIVFIFALSAAGQKLVKPTKMPAPPTAEQKKLIQEGVALHDAKNFDGAIAKYQQVLTENPDCTMAMYELSMTYFAKGDKVKSMETAYKGSAYISDELALFYGAMANCVDDVGKPDEAVRIYREAEAILKGDPVMREHLGNIYHNLGVTYVRQKKYTEARTELKKAIENSPNYGSPHYVLSIVYTGTKYKIPAFLAAARFLSIEVNTERSRGVAAQIRAMLKPAPKDPKTGSYTINLDFFAPTDEGDFGMYELLMGTLTTVKDDKDKNKTEDEMFVSAVGTIISLIAEDKKLKDTFVGKQYVPFIAELKNKGYSDVFGYTVLYLSGQEGAMNWLNANNAKFGEFIAWTKTYQAVKK